MEHTSTPVPRSEPSHPPAPIIPSLKASTKASKPKSPSALTLTLCRSCPQLQPDLIRSIRRKTELSKRTLSGFLSLTTLESLRSFGFPSHLPSWRSHLEIYQTRIRFQKQESQYRLLKLQPRYRYRACSHGHSEADVISSLASAHSSPVSTGRATVILLSNSEASVSQSSPWKRTAKRPHISPSSQYWEVILVPHPSRCHAFPKYEDPLYDFDWRSDRHQYCFDEFDHRFVQDCYERPKNV